MKEILCGKCHQANPGSSKFCNHCGNTLPPPDNIICPSCKASNPKKTYYCDECGTRLVTGKLGEDTSSVDAKKAVEDSIFSLPVRKPEDMGDFDPADLSSWVDSSANIDSTAAEGTGSLGTGGLPGWLVNDSDPLLDVPQEITTEHFNLLVNRDGEALPELPTQQDIELPDWLTGDDSAENRFSDDVPTGTTVPDWIPTPKTDKNKPTISGQTVADLGPQESEFDFENLFDFEDDTPESAAESVTAADSDDDDWLNDLAGDDDDLFAEKTAVSPAPPPTATAADSDDDDWLNDLTGDDDDLFAEKTAVSPTTPPTDSGEFPDWLTGDVATDTPANSDDDDWLNDLAGDDDDLFAEKTAVSPAPPPTATAADSDDDDWLNDLAGDDDDLFAEKTAVSPTTPPTDSGEFPDWLTGDVATDTAADSDDDDWLNDLAGDDDDLFAEETAVSPTTPPTDSGELPDWLADDIATATTVDDNNDSGDWLSDLGADGTDLFDSPAQSDSGGSLNWLDERPSTPDDDLDDIFAGTELIGDNDLDWLALDEETKSTPLPVDDSFMASGDADTSADDLWQDDADDAELEDEPNWLTEYATGLLETVPEEDEAPPIVEEMFIPQQLPEIDDDLEDFFATTDDDDDAFHDLFGDSAAFTAAAASTTAETDDFSLETTEHDLDFAAEMLGAGGLDWVGDNTADVGDDLPDWLDDLGEIDEKTEEIPIEAISTAAIVTDVPEWLADMQPGSDEGEGISTLSDTHSLDSSEDNDFDSLDFDEGELSDLGMPEWLHENATDDASAHIPAITTSAVVVDESIIDDLLDNDDDFADIDLSDLPPSIPLEDRLSKANIPNWIEEMKPAELTPEGAEPKPEPTPESAGPLAGIGGVIALQLVVSPSYDDVPVNQFAVTKEHQQQAALLRQLRQGERKLSSGMTQSEAKTSARMRMALILVVLLVALVGLLGPSLVTLPTEPSPALVAVHDELTAVSNLPVLVAFEYTPAMAGELTVQAETLLTTLADNDNPIVVVSQSAAGSTIAAAHLPEDGMQIGMVTGGAAGLRQLADCLNNADACMTLLGREVTSDERNMLGDISLIIVLTGERDSMVNWIEQVGTPTDLPLVMGLTTAIAPLAAPYHDSGQITGMMMGLTETAVYQQEWQSTADDDILSRLNAQALLQLTAALLLIAGSIYYGVINAKKKGK